MPDKWEYPVVCRVGPGIPCHRALHRGSGLRKATARPVAAGVLPAPERPDPGIRMELQRRKSARARLGDDLSLQDRASTPWQRRRGLPGPVLSKTDVELHLVGKPEGSIRQERLRGRVSGAGQHRRFRPQRAAARRRLSGAGRRHCLDGLVLPEHARDLPSNWRPSIPATTTWRRNSSTIFSGSPAP